MSARSQPRDHGKGQPGGPNPARAGRGQPASRDKWPASGPTRDWLDFCDQIRQDNGMPSLRTVGKMMPLAFNRIGELLRGEGLPVDEEQARNLLAALGALDREVERGARLYKAARAEQDQARRDAGQPDWWLRSGYADQVRDIAPPQLLGRQDEMDELHAWCASGDEAYVRWEAGPRAGKSALMAWLVLHPPPGTWVISFFVTASRNTQADSTAYTDGLLDQLAAITGEKVSPSASPGQRDQLRRQMLEQAAARAAEVGRRLVLVIDGLDEDCGSLPGSGLASIAACLPRRPQPALRVIVAARPDPPVPADVAPDHPLRGCRVRPLDASSYAAQVVHLAQLELDLTVATHKDGLGYQVLGLVTASGGGLDDCDLQQLTGQDASSIDRLLNGTFGRTIAARADPRTKTRAFQFTHDTLREQAISRLGPYTLAGFARRLHSWANVYRRGGWPQDTPGYLQHGYARMLADAGDIDRLTTLATDAARHRWMLDTTGGDTAALAEIAAAHSLIGTAESPDLLAALRLAWHRDHLTARNSRIPAELPAVWAALGQPARAEDLARSIPDPGTQAEALADVASAAAGTGDHDRAWRLAADAERIAGSVTERYGHARALAATASAAAAIGDHDRARRLAADAERITPPDPAQSSPWSVLAAEAKLAACAGDYDRAERIVRSDLFTFALPVHVPAEVASVVAAAGNYDRAEQIARSHPFRGALALALAVVARAAADAGDYDRAEALARSIPDPGARARPLADVARLAAGTQDYERARRLAADAESFARSITYPWSLAPALAGAARAAADAGDYERARRLAADAERIARSIPDPETQAQDAADVARAAAAAGDYDRAEALARPLLHHEMHTHALADVAELAAGARDYDRAEQIARSLPYPDDQWGLLFAVAELAARARDYDRAEQIALSFASPDRQAAILAEAAKVAAGAGDHQRAQEWAARAGRITLPILQRAQQKHDPAAVASAAAGAGDHQRAQERAADAWKIALSILLPREQAQDLTSVARAAADAGNYDHAEQIARSIPVPEAEARALTDVAELAAGARDYDRAERIARSIPRSHARTRALAAMVGAAEPAWARLWIAGALAAERWTIPLQALARIDPRAMSVFADELDNGPLSGTPASRTPS